VPGRHAQRRVVVAGTAAGVVALSRVLQRWQGVRRDVDTATRDLMPLVRGLAATVPVHTRVDVGHVADRLAAAVAAYRDDHPMLVISRRGGGSRGSAPGAVAWRVLAQADVPVLVYLPRQPK
jgi:hypothetical protein